jgi:FlaA1/EpsC-like NDP-sugar epimerase
MARILSHPLVRYRFPFIVLLHAAFAGLSLLLSFLLRFDFTLGSALYYHLFLYSLPVNIAVFLLFSAIFNLYQGIWRYVSVDDLLDIVKTSAITSLVFVFIIVLSGKFMGYPRSIYLLNFALFIILNGGTRFAIRIFRESFAPMSDTARNVLIVGAGTAGNEIAKTLKSAKQKEYIPVGFIDRDKQTHGKRIQGIKVLGDLSSIKAQIKKNRVHEIFIAIPEATNKVVKEIVDASKIPEWEVKFKIAPSLLDIMSGKLQVNQIRDVSIEDLLSRPNIRLDDTHIRSHLGQKTVMVTGAVGSIGTEICFQVATYGPAKMILLDLNEKNAYDIDNEMKKRYPNITFVTAVGSITSEPWVNWLLKEQRPNHIYHAAAYKHVHLMEWNPFPCLQNNVIGTSILADAAVTYGVEKFVMISTDKAVKPKAMMGISKRITERVVLERSSEEQTKFNVVRFGNVLGSSGSVVPFFQQQIKNGGPITVTDPEVTRYFMSIPEAVQLVLQAATLENTGCIYLLDMGAPIKIIDLATALIELSGLKLGDDIEIKFTGLRGGEKMHEELLIAESGAIKTPFEKIMVQKPHNKSLKEVQTGLEKLKQAIKDNDKTKLNEAIRILVPEATC